MLDLAPIEVIDPCSGSRLEPGVGEPSSLGSRILHRVSTREQQARFDSHARQSPRVRQHVFAPFDTIESRLGAAPEVVDSSGYRLVLTRGFGPGPRRSRQAPALLRIPNSWPAIPVWVRAEGWWRDRTVLSVTLRNRRRWRYPTRYHRAAHATLRELARQLVAAPSDLASTPPR